MLNLLQFSYKTHIGFLVKKGSSCKERRKSPKELCSARSDCFACPFVEKRGKPESEDREMASGGLG